MHVLSNAKQVLDGIKADQEKIRTAQIQAINRTADQVRTEAGREIRKIYNIKLRVVRDLSHVNRAGRNQEHPTAVVTFKGRSIPLIEFSPRERKAGMGRRSVSVQVLTKGGRKTVEGGFVATIRSGPLAGQKGIFRRVGRARFPIKFQTSISIPMVLRQQVIKKAMFKLANQRYAINFDAALKNQLRNG